MKRLLAAAAIAALCAACARSDDASAEDDQRPPQYQAQDPSIAYDAEKSAAQAARPAAAMQAPANGPARSGPAQPFRGMRFQPTVIVDATGFEQPMGASTLFIPYGWKTQGGVEWGQQYMCTNGYAFNWSAYAPDGSQAIAILPAVGWESSNYGAGASTPGCQNLPYTNIRQFLEALAQNWRPGARVIDYRDRPDIVKELGMAPSSTPAPGGEMRRWVESGEVLVAFSDRGRDMRGSVSAAAVFNMTRTNYGMGDMTALSIASLPAYAVSAPNGALNLGLFEAIRHTIKVSPAWSQRIANHNTAIARVALEENAKRSKMITESNEYMSRLQQETWSAYQESADRRAREFGELIKGVETYDDANAPGGTVELSHNYNDAWRLNDGSYVLSNDPNFDPWRDLQMEGQKLEATQ